MTIPGRLSEVVKELACLVRPLWRPEVSQEMPGDDLEAGRQRQEQEQYNWARRLEAQTVKCPKKIDTREPPRVEWKHDLTTRLGHPSRSDELASARTLYKSLNGPVDAVTEKLVMDLLCLEEVRCLGFS